MYHAIVIFRAPDARILSRATGPLPPPALPTGAPSPADRAGLDRSPPATNRSFRAEVAVASVVRHAACCMKLSLALPLFSLLTLAGCGLLGGNDATAASTMPKDAAAAQAAPTIDLGKLLGGITDGNTATAAKSPLESAVAQLKTALAGADAKAKVDAAAGNADASAGKKMVDDVLAKFGLGGETVGQITALLQNEQVKAVLGPTLEQLKSLLPAGL